MPIVKNKPVSSKQQLLTKWRKMLEHKRMAPLSNRKKPVVANMMENQFKRSKGLLKEEKLTTTDIQNFDTVLIPMIRRIAPELIALDILGTQVMEKPAQLIFALRAFLSGRDGTLGDSPYGYSLPGGRAKATDRNDTTVRSQILLINKADTGNTYNYFAKDGDLYDIMANTAAYKKGYFLGNYAPGETSEIKIYGKMIEFDSTGEVTVKHSETIEGTLYYAEQTTDIFKVVVELSDANQTAGDKFNQWMVITDDEDNFDDFTVGATPSDAALDKVTTLKNAFENEIMYNVIFNNYSGKYTTAEMEAAKTWNEVSFDIASTTVHAEGRLLKAKYSLEVAEDLMSYHNIDAEEELINMISYEILAEMNREVVERIYDEALSGGNGFYNWQYGTQSTGADGRWHAEKYHGLYTLMNKVAGDIAISSRRGTANFAITSMPVKVALESVAGYSLWTDVNNNFNSQAGIVYAGTLAGKYKIFVDTFAGSDYILMGYKGDSEYDAGLFYCPFIPLTAIKAVDPENFQPRLGFRTRYGIGENPFGANLYYRYVNVEGLDDSFGAEYSYVPTV